MSRFRCFVLLVAALALPLSAAEEPLNNPPRISTYAAYEMRLQRVETVWPDVRAITTRQPGGGYTAALVDASGRQLAQRWVTPLDPNVSISRLNEAMERQYRRESRGPLSRGIGTDASRNDGEKVEETQMPSRVTMDFDGFTVDTFRDIFPASERKEGTAYSTFHTVLRDGVTGEQLGLMRWFAKEQVLVWTIEKMGKLGEGLITPERLEKVGGWQFTPDMAWAGIQILVLRDSADRVKTRRELSASSLEVGTLTCDGLSDGCTGLHWLDDTVYRQCCDEHDKCFEYAPPDGCCTAWSWIFPLNWQCVKCNLQVLRCFLTAGGGGIKPELPGDDCTTELGGWCPPSCFSCSSGGGRPRI